MHAVKFMLYAAIVRLHSRDPEPETTGVNRNKLIELRPFERCWGEVLSFAE